MYDKLISVFSLENIFYKHQYGFRPKQSTIHPVIHFLNHCAEANNKTNPEYTLAVFCDLSKAFDVIDHTIILDKLNHYGIRGIANNWFQNYLTNRQQYVQLENSRSSLKPIKCGVTNVYVPQGSILGPLLYLIYVNDIENSCDSNILSFADDTTIYSSHSDINSLFEMGNTDINNLYTWFCTNKLSVNAGNTKYIIIKPRQRHCDISGRNIAINNVSYNCSETSTKFLGILIDENLSWKQHISYLNSKILKTLFTIKQVKHILPYDSLRKLYSTLVESHLSYGIMAWRNASESPKYKTLLLQKRAIRAINKANYNSHTEPLFKRSKILKLNDLYELKVILFVNDFIANKLPLSLITSSHLTMNVHILETSIKFTLPRKVLFQIFRKDAFVQFSQIMEQMVLCVSKSTYFSIPLKIQHDGVTVS